MRLTRNRTLGLTHLACLAGLFAAWMLSLSYLALIPLPCGDSTGCTRVALSSAARVFGVPTPVYGLAFYAFLDTLVIRALIHGQASALAFAVALAGAVVSTGFTVYSVFVLRAECAWCVGSNVAACIATLLLALVKSESPILDGKREIAFVLASVIVAAVGIAVASRMAFLSAERFPWNPAELSRLTAQELAPPDSIVFTGHFQTAVVVFLDPECPECQIVFPRLLSQAQQTGTSLAVRYLPEPIHPGSLAISILCEEATSAGRGTDFLLALCKRSTVGPAGAVAMLRRMGVPDTLADRQHGRQRVNRDLALAKRLGLRLTPSMFRITVSEPPEAMFSDEIN